MRSFEDLRLSARTAVAREQLDEVVRAYNAGAYRTATVGLWIAVVHDLTDKLRVLADSGDGNAFRLIEEIERARNSENYKYLQAFESELLSKARDDFELISAREYNELLRLKRDRNLCAHPSFRADADDPYEMSEEQVRAYIVLVAEAVLAQPPIVGRQLVDRFSADTSSESWPDEDLTGFLRDRYFRRARRNVIRNILRVATKAAIRPPDGDNRAAGRCVATLTSSIAIDEALTLDSIRDVLTKWRDHLSDHDLLRTIGAVGTYAIAWDSLGPENVARARVLLSTSSLDALIQERVFASGVPAHPDVARSYQEALGRLDADKLDLLTKGPYPKAQWVDVALRELDNVITWRGGERMMRILLMLASELGLDDVRRIADQFLTNDQINRASDVPQLLLRLVEGTMLIVGAREVWIETLVHYRESYTRSRTSDPGGYYSYSETLSYLKVPPLEATS